MSWLASVVSGSSHSHTHTRCVTVICHTHTNFCICCLGIKNILSVNIIGFNYFFFFFELLVQICTGSLGKFARDRDSIFLNFGFGFFFTEAFEIALCFDWYGIARLKRQKSFTNFRFLLRRLLIEAKSAQWLTAIPVVLSVNQFTNPKKKTNERRNWAKRNELNDLHEMNCRWCCSFCFWVCELFLVSPRWFKKTTTTTNNTLKPFLFNPL